jgi:adenylate kinase
VNAIIFGAPGAGKGTYSSRLKEKGLLVPNDIVIDVLKKRLNEVPKGKGFILDGYPRTIEQAETLEGIAKIDVILLQMVPDWIIIERLSSRRICNNCGAVYNIRFLKPKVEGICDKCGGPLYQRSDDRPEVIKQRLQVYQEQTSPLLRYYKEKNVPFIVSSITALDTPPESIVEKMIKELKKLNLA